jgi:uncharacterized membrane protein SpoIIM required for sporulation
LNTRIWIQKYKFVLVILVGIVIGTCYTNFFPDSGNGAWNVFGSDYLSLYSDVTVNSMLLWEYVMKSRIRDFALLCLLGLTTLCRPVLMIYLLYLGMCSGVLISIAVMHYGFTGIMLYLASVLPQYLFYGAALYLIYRILYQRKAQPKNICIVLLIAVVLLIIGTYTEAYINPEILKRLYAYLY